MHRPFSIQHSALSIPIAAFLCACGGSPSSPSGGGSGTDNGLTVTIAPTGVSPVQLTVSLGSRVMFINHDTRAHDIEWDPHPTHDGCPPPSVGPAVNAPGFLAPGRSRETGNLVYAMTCGYHDHDDAQNPRWQGRITAR
jgi:plastocyanin